MLGSSRLFYLDYSSYERAMVACSAVFHAWDDSMKEFTNVAREMTRKRTERFIPIKVQSAHQQLQERISYLRGFRKQHHQLQVMVGPLGTEARTLSEGDRSGLLADIDMDAEVRALRPV